MAVRKYVGISKHDALQNFVSRRTGRTEIMTMGQLDLQSGGVYSHPNLTSDDLDASGFRGQVGFDMSRKITDADLRNLHDMLSRMGSGEYNEELILDNFNRFYKIWPDLEFPTSIVSYVFITRPELNLYRSGGDREAKLLVDENANDPRVRYMNTDYPEILHMLTSDYSTNHDFIPFLQGRTESLQIPDFELATHDFMIPYYNFKMPYPGVSNESMTGGNFDITFREDNRMRVFKMFDFWIYYIDAIMKDKLKASRDNIIKNEMEYMCSIYQFLCDPSSERILFWSKYTGCFPYAVPMSNLSHSLHNAVDNKVTVSFKYSYVEHMDPMILTDFAYNSRADQMNDEEFVEVYDDELAMTGTTLVGMPVIYRNRSSKDYVLKWYRRRAGMSSKLPSTEATFVQYDQYDSAITKFKDQKRGENMQKNSAKYAKIGASIDTLRKLKTTVTRADETVGSGSASQTQQDIYAIGEGYDY